MLKAAFEFGANHAEVIPAQSVVHGGARRHAPRVKHAVGSATILEGVACPGSFGRTATVDGTGEEIVERVENELAAMARVNKAVDEGAAPFQAGLEAVAARDVGDIAEELVVGVNAAACIARRGTDRTVSGDVDGGQAQIERAEAGRQRIEAVSRIRVEARVLRHEVLHVAVESAANFKDEVGARDRGVGERNDVDVRRRRCVEAGCAAAGVKHAERKTLPAVRKEVATGEQIAGRKNVEMLIDLGDQVVAVVAEGGGERLAASAGGQRTPGTCTEQPLDDGIHDAA